MEIKIYILLSIFLSILFNSCDKEKNIDTEKPKIDIGIQGAFPVNCDTLYFGESFKLKVLLSDNVELGSYSIDVHNNFNQHSHSTEVTECSLDPKKEPINPFTLIQDYDIPTGLKEYETTVSITIPSNNSTGYYDDGDYHFYINLTDKEGWSVQKGLSIKMLHR